jgi:hypothetical protein
MNLGLRTETEDNAKKDCSVHHSLIVSRQPAGARAIPSAAVRYYHYRATNVCTSYAGVRVGDAASQVNIYVAVKY